MRDETPLYDTLIIGGGINGTGIARDAAGRGLKVLLCEQDDLASHTSSASTKLIHGGLRYLEHGEFRLVSKALKEREVLLKAAPHIIWPLRFVLPHEPHLRPTWMIRAGLFLYDHLARRDVLPPSESINLATHRFGEPLRAPQRTGFVYSDAWVDDARLVVVNALDAHERGAMIHLRTRCVGLTSEGTRWVASLQSPDGNTQTIRARSVINAAGPWVTRFLNAYTPIRAHHAVRLVRGSHIVVPKLFEHEAAYLFQNVDGRVVFAVPYEQHFTLLGTTDVDDQSDPTHPSISSEETSYLCTLATHYFKQSVTPEDVVFSYSGVRPLLQDESTDPKSVTRDYDLEWSCESPPLMSVFGGKLTTYRRLAEDALALLQKKLGTQGTAWTAKTPLPGADAAQGDFSQFAATTRLRYAHAPSELIERLIRTYGTRLTHWWPDGKPLAALGPEVLPGLYAAEIQYLRQVEWACTAEDILWRRTKLGLHLEPSAISTLNQWLLQHPA